MKTIKQTYLINASIEKVYQALVDPKVIDEWGGGEVKMSDQVGFEFSLWGGDIYGKNTEVIKNEKLVQDWKENEWDEYSKVTFNLSEENGETKLELIHENIPDKEASNINDGWKRYYLGPLKELLEHS